MKCIKSDAELQQIRTVGNGLIYNDFSRMGPSGKYYNILHAAYCPQLAKANVNVPKYFFDTLDEAITWLHENRGEEGVNWKRGGICRAIPRPVSINSSESKPGLTQTSTTEQEPAPFREAEVKQILVKHLRQKGYQVREEVLVSNGKVDIVGHGPDGSQIMIEAKGEDAGGYNTAKMNFQVGVGQIISRMTDPRSDYALAIPMTRDFKKVLKEYKGSIGFERLGLLFFLVYRDSKVDKYDATAMAAFIHTL